MLNINDVTYYIGERQLYNKCSLSIGEKDKIGLIGPNGAGKSTLIKLIIDSISETNSSVDKNQKEKLQPDSGSISIQPGYNIGYFNQDMLSLSSDESIKNVAMQAFNHVLELKDKEESILKKMEIDCTEELINELSSVQEDISRLGGYEMESNTESVLEGMGFKTSDLDKPFSQFSGGWRMRVLFAKLLLEHPSLLILDEPTNHLDIESIKWLEKYLIDYNEALIIISHDRYFLDHVVNRIVELENKELISYSGNYSFYEVAKEERLTLQENRFKTQQKQIEQTKEFINKFRSKATKAKQVQSRIKMLDKMDKVEAVVRVKPKVKFSFEVSQNSGKVVATMSHICKSYGDLTILNDSNGLIEKGDKIALIGANGRGKSTLLRMLAKYEEPDSGTIEYGPQVTTAFYAQHQLEALNLENNVYQELVTVNPTRTEQDIRKIAGMFLFARDDVYKPIKVLSGGEKARVALAKMLLSGGNFLLFDEPTNHLDIISIDVLGQAIQQYNGTCIVVSHDRHFVSQVANKIWYIKDHVLKEYIGGYEEFEQDVKEKL